MIEFIKLVGGIAGFVALIWRVTDVIGAYVQMQISIRKDESARIVIDTMVENKLHFGKEIDAAFLLVGPEFEDPEETGRLLKEVYPKIGDFASLNQMVSTIAKTICNDAALARLGIFDDRGRAIVPLTFYYWENVDVGDERLTCSCSIEKSKFPPGAYATRFYVEPKGKRLFRSVQTVFQVPPNN